MSHDIDDVCEIQADQDGRIFAVCGWCSWEAVVPQGVTLAALRGRFDAHAIEDHADDDAMEEAVMISG